MLSTNYVTNIEPHLWTLNSLIDTKTWNEGLFKIEEKKGDAAAEYVPVMHRQNLWVKSCGLTCFLIPPDVGQAHSADKHGCRRSDAGMWYSERYGNNKYTLTSKVITT